MISNFNKDFFGKNTGIKLCTIALTGIMVASPFIVKGTVDYAINDLKNHNEPAVVQEQVQEEDKSRIYFEYEGEFNLENGAIAIYENKDRKPGEVVEMVASMAPSAEENFVDLPAGSYVIANYNDKYEIELDGESEYSFTVNYQSGEITNNNEQNIQEPRSK